MPILLKVFQKTEEHRILPNYFYEARIPLVPKSEKDSIRKEKLQADICIEPKCKICNKTEFNCALKRSYTMIK